MGYQLNLLFQQMTNNKNNKKLNYISLFSSTGVGCYGFNVEDFNCVVTNELLDKRLFVQKCNNVAL